VSQVCVSTTVRLVCPTLLLIRCNRITDTAVHCSGGMLYMEFMIRLRFVDSQSRRIIVPATVENGLPHASGGRLAALRLGKYAWRRREYQEYSILARPVGGSSTSSLISHLIQTRPYSRCSKRREGCPMLRRSGMQVKLKDCASPVKRHPRLRVVGESTFVHYRSENNIAPPVLGFQKP